MSRSEETAGPLVLEGLFNVWKANNFDLSFYFREIFDKVFAVLQARTPEKRFRLRLKNGEPACKALFVPVGLSLENVALMSALFSPSILTLALSETSRYAGRKTLSLIESKLREISPAMEIERLHGISSEDQASIEKRIVEWAARMQRGYGFPAECLALDLTGGTKPMSIGAQNAAVSLDIPAYYLSVLYDEETQTPLPGTESLVRMPRRQSQTDDNLVFVIMPFKVEYDPVLDAIESAVSAHRMRCIRADKEIFSGPVMDRVQENLEKAKIIVAEVSEPNPNVFYELGFAHAWKKEVVLLNHAAGHAPFDIRHLRMVCYDRGNVDGLKTKLEMEFAARSAGQICTRSGYTR